jgi:hypothetical protein
MRPGQRKQGYERLLRGVRDEEVAGSNPVTPTPLRLKRPDKTSLKLEGRGLDLVGDDQQ